MNKRVFTAVGVLFLLLVGWVLNDLGIISIPFLSDSDSKKTALGTITQKVKNVQRRSKDSLSWDDVGPNEKVYGYDSVLTLEDSTAFIKMANGIDLNVEQNSLITIVPPDAGHDALSLNLKSGSYKVSMKKGSHLKMAGVNFTSGSDAALDFKAGPDSQIHMTVIAGAVDVINPGTGSTKRVPAAAGQAYTIDSVHSKATFDGAVAEVIPPAPIAAVAPPVQEPAQLPSHSMEQQQETTPAVHKKAIRKAIVAPTMPAESQDGVITQSAPISDLGAPSKNEAVTSRPDPEMVSQDLSELPVVALATAPTPPPSEEAPKVQETPEADSSNMNSQSTQTPVEPEAAAVADTQAYDSEMAKAKEPEVKPPAPPDDNNTNASDWSWTRHHYTVWAGTSLNYISYSQDSASTGGLGTQGVGIPSHLVFNAQLTDKWGANVFYENVNGAPSYTGNITQWNYNWVSYGAEVTYVAKNDLDTNGEGSEIVVTLGAEEVSIPFISVQPSGPSVVNKDNDLMFTVGAQYNINHSKRWRYEFDAHFKYPLTASASNGDSFTIQPQYGFEGSAGLVYRLTNHFSAGTDFRAEYFKNGYSYSSPSLGAAYSGSQTFMYLTFELKLGYSF